MDHQDKQAIRINVSKVKEIKGVNPAFVAHIGHDFVYLFSPWFLRKEGRAKKS